jgi:hypothetical protein
MRKFEKNEGKKTTEKEKVIKYLEELAYFKFSGVDTELL